MSARIAPLGWAGEELPILLVLERWENGLAGLAPAERADLVQAHVPGDPAGVVAAIWAIDELGGRDAVEDFDGVDPLGHDAERACDVALADDAVEHHFGDPGNDAR